MRTIRDSHRINMRNYEGPTWCPPERAQVTTANIQKYILIKSKHLKAALLGRYIFLKGNLPAAPSCSSLSFQLCRDTVASPYASQDGSAPLSRERAWNHGEGNGCTPRRPWLQSQGLHTSGHSQVSPNFLTYKTGVIIASLTLV